MPPTPESESTSDPVAEYSTPEPNSSPNPEPLPDWDTALEEWKSLWYVHYIGFGTLFVALAVFSCFCLIRLTFCRKANMSLKNYFVVVCALLLTMTLSRALYLLLDPYESHELLHLPVLVPRVLFAIGYPCLTSAFSLLHFAFLEVSKLRLISRRLQNIKFLSSVITIHFLFVLIVYLIVTFFPKLARLLIICQSILISWWLVLCACFIYSGWKVNWEARITKKYLDGKQAAGPRDTEENESLKSEAVEQLKRRKKESQEDASHKGTNKIARISGIVAGLALISVAVELYSLFGVYNLYTLSEEFVKPWPWWGYQTCVRSIEVALCCVLAYVVYPTVRTQRKEDRTQSMTAQTRHSVASTRNTMVRNSTRISADSLNKMSVAV